MFVNDTFWRGEGGTGGVLVTKEKRELDTFVRERGIRIRWTAAEGIMRFRGLEKKKVVTKKREESVGYKYKVFP